tara:strand:+ start:638 stop:1687 length:1050 start_codon:yes stop_codon:yes gene_type:complete
MQRKLRIGINGLGRIGRQIFKLVLNEENIQVVGINEINTDINNWAYMLNFDSIYGKLENKVIAKDNKLAINNNEIKTSSCNNIKEIPIEEWDIDIMVDCTGILDNVINAKDLINNKKVKKILITHSPEEVDFTMILGVNEHLYNAKKQNIIASSICDATAIAPVTKLINDQFSIKNGFVTTLHPWLSYQNLMDGPSSSWSVPGKVYHHYALGRSAISGLIPKPTSALDAVFRVLPQINPSKIGSFSYRTPTQIVGSADITYYLEKEVSKSTLLDIFYKFENSQKYPILKITDEPLISNDYIGEKFSAILDLRWLEVIDKKLIKLVLWYDNELGYSYNVLNQLKFIYSQF